MLKYLLIISLTTNICTSSLSKVKNGDFSREDAEHFIKLLEGKKMLKMIENGKGIDELEKKEGIKFNEEFKIILAKLNKKIVGEKAKKIIHRGEWEEKELYDKEKEQLTVAYLHLFGSNLLEKLLEYSFLNEEVFHKNHSLKFLGPKSIEKIREEMGKMWKKFYDKAHDILQTNINLKLDEKFVRDLAEKLEFEDNLWQTMLAKNVKNKMEKGMKEAGMDYEMARKKFPFKESQRLLDYFCEIIGLLDLGDDVELRKKVELKMGTFKCPEDKVELIELLRGTIFALDKNERKNMLKFLTSHYFYEEFNKIRCYDFPDLLEQEGRWHIPLFWGLQKQMGQATFRFLMSNFFNPMFKLLGKFGDQCILEGRCFLEIHLFGHFLLEFTIELAKREGDPGAIHFQGGLSEQTADILENPPPKLAKFVNECRKYSVDMLGQMPKKVADSMRSMFNSAGVEIGLLEKKLKKFVEEEKKKKIEIVEYKN